MSFHSRAFFASVALPLALGACQGRTPSEPARTKSDNADAPLSGPAIMELDLSRGVGETSQGGLFAPPGKSTFGHLVRLLREAQDDDRTKGVLVRIGGAAIGFGRAHEIGRMLGALRAKEKPVVCHADEYTNATMLLASLGCSRIWVSPAGGVDTVGIAAQLMFFNKLLGKLKIEANYLQIGKYKGAEEPFTRDAPSPEARSSLETALTGIRAAWLAATLEGRKEKLTERALEDGPYAPLEAKSKGFVDDVGYLDDARDEVKKLADTKTIAKRFGGGDAQPSLARALAEAFRGASGSSGPSRIAVLPAAGAISMAAAGGLLGGEEGITERALGKQIARLTDDTTTKAVVLRIDSPGGSALASDLLWKRLMKLREKKPLVVSVGGMAASGGYYLACSGTKIFAEKTSIVGSIGVVGGKLALGQALEEAGVHTETVAATSDAERAARAAYMSPFSTWDEATRGKVRASMQAIYDLFLQRVSEGRGIDTQKVAPFAEGRLFAGERAKELGMIDEIGGLDDAVRLAIDLAKVPADTPVDILGGSSGLFDTLAGDEPQGDGEGSAPSSVAAAAQRTAVEVIAEPWMRAAPEIPAFVTALSPFFHGERVIAVAPFAIVLR